MDEAFRGIGVNEGWPGKDAGIVNLENIAKGLE